MSPSGSIGSAPREISVSALSSVHDVVGFDLGTFQYDISGNAVQVYLCSILFDIKYIIIWYINETLLTYTVKLQIFGLSIRKNNFF